MNKRDNEKPQHEVTLPDFWMAKYPVTVAQFRAFTEATKYSFEHWQYNNTATNPLLLSLGMRRWNTRNGWIRNFVSMLNSRSNLA